MQRSNPLWAAGLAFILGMGLAMLAINLPVSFFALSILFTVGAIGCFAVAIALVVFRLYEL